MRTTVSADILDIALRGGEPARILAKQCAERRLKAHAAVLLAVHDAPGILRDSRVRSEDLVAQKNAMSQELDTLSVSLNDLVEYSQRLVEKASIAEDKIRALDELAECLTPFVLVSNAIRDSEAADVLDVQDCSKSLKALENASRVALESNNQQLRELTHVLQDRVSEVTAMMQFRFLDLVDISENRISINLRSTPHMAGHAFTPAQILSKAGLLDEALRAIVEKLVSNNVAEKLRSAAIFFATSASGTEGPGLEWSDGDDAGGELLEFDLDDLEDIPEQDVDNMTNAVDIANGASRAVAVFDLLRSNLVGETFSSQLALAFSPWLIDHILPPSVAQRSLRPQYKHTGVPSNSLHARVLATNSAARTLQTALYSRGADPSQFKMRIDVSSIENLIAKECRGQALLAARRAIGLFADARRDSAQTIPCPLSHLSYVPREERSQDYFPACKVSQAAATVLDIFSSTRTDAIHALSGGSAVIGSALMAAAYECADAYRVDVPLQHGDDMRSSLRLKSLYYNDCMMLKYACQKSIEMDADQQDLASRSKEQLNGEHVPLSSSSSKDRLSISVSLAKAAESVMINMRQTAEKSLIDNLNSACRNGALGAYGTLIRIQRSSALMSAYNSMRELVGVFADVMPVDIAEAATATLCEKYLTRLCDAVLDLDEILPDGCTQIEGIFDDALSKSATLFNSVRTAEMTQSRGSESDVVIRYERARGRALAYKHFVGARMEDIVTYFRAGKYCDSIDRRQVESFLVKIFEDTPLRATFIAELDITKEAEEQEWEEW